MSTLAIAALWSLAVIGAAVVVYVLIAAYLAYTWMDL